MKITAMFSLAFGFMTAGPCAYAAEIQKNSSLDFQFRVPFHFQYFAESRTNDYKLHLGVAAWAVMGDVLAENNRTATLFVGGTLLTYGKGSFVEMMGGARRGGNGKAESVINLRFLEKSSSRLGVFGDLQYFPDEEGRRFYAFLSADTPVSLGRYSMRVGLESENIFSFSAKKGSFGVGPRIVLPIPQKLVPDLKAALAVGYQHRTDRDFLRCYFTLTYPLSRKRK